MATMTEDDVLEQLDAQEDLLAFMAKANDILSAGRKDVSCRRCS